jgi:hypothetical protein
MSFAPLGLVGSHTFPTAYAVGCILAPLRGYGLTLLFRLVVETPDLTHTVNRPDLLVAAGGVVADVLFERAYLAV